MEQLSYSLQTAWDWLMTWWSGLREGARDNIIGGLAVAALTGGLALIWTIIKRFATEKPSSTANNLD
jgi:hypothetical protein